MHGFRRTFDRAAEEMRNSLESQAHAKNGDGRFQDDLSTYSEVAVVFRPAWTRRDDDAVGIERKKLLPGQHVVMDDNRQFAINRRHHLEQIECKRIVIIDDQSFHEQISHFCAFIDDWGTLKVTTTRCMRNLA